MASKHREERILAEAACPACGANIGDPCRVIVGPNEGRTALVRLHDGSMRPVVHAARRQAWQRLRQYDAQPPETRAEPKTILWCSRHDPTPSQLAELTRLWPGQRLILDRDTFRDADDIADRVRRLDADEMVIVAPLNVLSALLDRGIKPVWPEMEKLSGPDGAEVTMRRRDGRVDYYRFVRFRRLIALEMRFEDL